MYILRDLLPRNFNLVAYSENHYQRKTWTSNRKVGKINWKSKIFKSLSLSWYILLSKCNTRFYADLLKKIIYLLSFSFLRKESESFFIRTRWKMKQISSKNGFKKMWYLWIRNIDCIIHYCQASLHICNSVFWVKSHTLYHPFITCNIFLQVLLYQVYFP